MSSSIEYNPKKTRTAHECEYCGARLRPRIKGMHAWQCPECTRVCYSLTNNIVDKYPINHIVGALLINGMSFQSACKRYLRLDTDVT